MSLSIFSLIAEHFDRHYVSRQRLPAREATSVHLTPERVSAPKLSALTAAFLLVALVIAVALMLLYSLRTPCTVSSVVVAPKASGSAIKQAQPAQIYIGVVSGSANQEKREAIRRSWGSDQRLLRVVFVVAKPTSNSALSKSIRQEAMLNRDLILVSHVKEHYFNITHQTLEIYRSVAAFGRPVTHVMKCDDDSYVHVGRLIALLDAHPQNHTFFGRISTSYEPDRNPHGKWYISKEEWPPSQSNISWANGPGYVLTADMALELAAGAAVDCTPGELFKLEDVATGIWLGCLAKEKGWHMRIVSNAHFNVLGCAAGDIVSHYHTARQMACMFARQGDCCG